MKKQAIGVVGRLSGLLTAALLLTTCAREPVRTAERRASTPLYENTRFLYEGPRAVQHGMDPGLIDPQRVAVLQGQVRGEGGAALPGVRVTVVHHGEFGWTETQEGGAFYLVVNAQDAPLRLSFEKEGLLRRALAATGR